MNWKKTNYGGNPTKPSGQRALFVGRWQPYHKGHSALVEQKLNQGIPALVLVRDMEPDEKNPFTSEETARMIRAHHESRGEDVKVMVIPDIESVNFGRGVGYEVNYFEPEEELAMISATRIRESLKSGDEQWREMVEEAVQPILEELFRSRTS
jgi:nicotinamide mononucleotide adenylyltransferase